MTKALLEKYKARAIRRQNTAERWSYESRLTAPYQVSQEAWQEADAHAYADAREAYQTYRVALRLSR